MKISIIGAGNVGATLAKRLAEENLSDVVLLDIAKNVAEGKALDLLHAASITGAAGKITGTDDYSETKDSDIVIVTAGFPRQPGMTRGDLIKKNSSVVKEVVKNVKNASPKAILIIVTNPLDIMTYLAYKESGFKRNRVMGMAGTLDSSRFVHIISEELKKPASDIDTLVIGQHGPAMVPLVSHTKVSGKPIAELVAKEKISHLVTELRGAGAKIVNLLGKGSAFYAPSAACLAMIRSIINNDKSLLSACCFTEGEYGFSGLCIGLPVRLGANGIEEIVELELSDDETASLAKAAEMIKGSLSEL